jgi:hypothetical protein
MQNQESTALIWYCSRPLPVGGFIPTDDYKYLIATADEKITALQAAKHMLETCDENMEDGTILEVWVWQPGGIKNAQSFLATVEIRIHFEIEPNTETEAKTQTEAKT